MSYQFKAQEPVPVAIKRIANEQIESSIHSLTCSIKADRATAIHSARKHFKKLRALVRLVRDDVGKEAYKQENVCFRDAGRELSDVRDAKVRITTLDNLVDHYRGTINPEHFGDIRQILVNTYKTVQESEGTSQQEIAAIISKLESAHARIQEWRIQDEWDAIQNGLHRVYKRGYKDFFQASERPTQEHLHEWRKRVKYLWYHLRLLSPMWSEVLNIMKTQVKHLSDLLGDDHDLALLRDFIVDKPEEFADHDQLGVLLALIQQRRLELQYQAHCLGQRLYAEKPKAFKARMGVYWQVWRTEMSKSSRVPHV